MENKIKYAMASSIELIPLLKEEGKSAYRFRSKIEAINRLKQIANRYLISKENDEDITDSLILWIRDYALTEGEISEGRTGNFCLIQVHPDDERYTLVATKQERATKFHPQGNRRSYGAPMPNWGHPFLRKIKKGIIFEEPYEARLSLLKLHEEFPTRSIPAGNRLYLMIFSREYFKEVGKPCKKFIFEISETETGATTIKFWENPSTGPLKRYKFHAFNLSTF